MKWKATAVFVMLGFVGAAIFYSPYIGINGESPAACPVCPHITTIHGTPTERFVRFTLVNGMLNAALFVIVGWVGIFVVRILGRALSNRGEEG